MGRSQRFTHTDYIKLPETRRAIQELIQRKYKFPTLILALLISAFYVTGIYLLIVKAGTLTSTLSIPLLTISMVWSFYLSHDCAHYLALKNKKTNLLLGEALTLVNGLSYTSFLEYRKDHLKHHAGKVDLIGFDIQKFQSKSPGSTMKIALMLEYLYIPAFFFIIKAHSMWVSVFGRKKDKARAFLLTLIYATLTYTLASASWLSLALFMLAIFLRIHVVRFVDAFQHSYQKVHPESDTEKLPREYEFTNTFSLPVARKHTYLNLLTLNFGYHRAHHAVPSCPWYLLGKLDGLIFCNATTDLSNVEYLREKNVSFNTLLYMYHKYRIERIVSKSEGYPYDENGSFNMPKFMGAFTDNLLG